jgi:hypothetical protein
MTDKNGFLDYLYVYSTMKGRDISKINILTAVNREK